MEGTGYFELLPLISVSVVPYRALLFFDPHPFSQVPGCLQGWFCLQWRALRLFRWPQHVEFGEYNGSATSRQRPKNPDLYLSNVQRASLSKLLSNGCVKIPRHNF